MICHFSFSSPCTDSFPQHGRRRYTLQYAELILETSFLHRSLESAILLNSPALTLIRAKPFYTSTMENYCYEVCLGKNADFWSVMRELFLRRVNRDFQKVAKRRAFLNTTFKVRKRVIFPPFDACRGARHKIDLDVVNTNTISPYECIIL